MLGGGHSSGFQVGGSVGEDVVGSSVGDLVVGILVVSTLEVGASVVTVSVDGSSRNDTGSKSKLLLLLLLLLICMSPVFCLIPVARIDIMIMVRMNSVTIRIFKNSRRVFAFERDSLE